MEGQGTKSERPSRRTAGKLPSRYSDDIVGNSPDLEAELGLEAIRQKKPRKQMSAAQDVRGEEDEEDEEDGDEDARVQHQAKKTKNTKADKKVTEKRSVPVPVSKPSAKSQQRVSSAAE